MPRKREPDHEQNLVEPGPSTYAGSVARPAFYPDPCATKRFVGPGDAAKHSIDQRGVLASYQPLVELLAREEDPPFGQVVLRYLSPRDHLLEGLRRLPQVGRPSSNVSHSSGEIPLSSLAVLASDSAVWASICATPPSAVASTPSRMRFASPSIRVVSSNGFGSLTQRPQLVGRTAREPPRSFPHVS
jgi:hypothetical protein